MTALQELISVSLEIVAFFFVTIDLYGEERLKAANEKLSKVTEFLLNKCRQAIRGWLELKESDKEFPVVGFGFLAVFLCTPFCYFMIFVFVQSWSRPFDPLLVSFEIFGLPFFGLGSIALTLFSILCIFTGIVFTASWVLGRLRFSGLLLGVGAVMFLIAKGMVWWHFFKEVHGS